MKIDVPIPRVLTREYTCLLAKRKRNIVRILRLLLWLPVFFVGYRALVFQARYFYGKEDEVQFKVTVILLLFAILLFFFLLKKIIDPIADIHSQKELFRWRVEYFIKKKRKL